MPFHTYGAIRYYTFHLLEKHVPHAVFTRHGGVSPSPWDSLNLGGTVGDSPQRVAENKARALTAFGRSPESLFEVWQVHGCQVAIAEAPRAPQAPLQQADAILTNRPEVTLLMRFADCVPILLYDPRQRVVGLAHAGWQGTVKGTALAAIRQMQAQYGSRPEEILAAIGPSIGPDHYEVGLDVVRALQQAMGAQAEIFLTRRDGGVFLDLWAANRWWLERAGVRQIEIAALCTACHVEDWYSHRAHHGRTGRFGVMIALEAERWPRR